MSLPPLWYPPLIKLIIPRLPPPIFPRQFVRSEDRITVLYLWLKTLKNTCEGIHFLAKL